MTRYIVFEPPAAAGEPIQPSADAVFVSDGFAKWALLFPFLWLFRHGLILSGLLVLAASVAPGLMAETPGFGFAAAVLPLLLGLLVALEGPSLRAARCRRRGYHEVAVVDAADSVEAAILYYHGAAGAAAIPSDRAPSPERPAVFPNAPRHRPQSLLDPAGYR